MWAYFLFVFTTAIAAHYELINPVFKELRIRAPKDALVYNSTIAHITAFILSLLVAPILIVPTIIPSAGETFRVTLLESLIG